MSERRLIVVCTLLAASAFAGELAPSGGWGPWIVQALVIAIGAAVGVLVLLALSRRRADVDAGAGYPGGVDSETGGTPP